MSLDYDLISNNYDTYGRSSKKSKRPVYDYINDYNNTELPPQQDVEEVPEPAPVVPQPPEQQDDSQKDSGGLFSKIWDTTKSVWDRHQQEVAANDVAANRVAIEKYSDPATVNSIINDNSRLPMMPTMGISYTPPRISKEEATAVIANNLAAAKAALPEDVSKLNAATAKVAEDENNLPTAANVIAKAATPLVNWKTYPPILGAVAGGAAGLFTDGLASYPLAVGGGALGSTVQVDDIYNNAFMHAKDLARDPDTGNSLVTNEEADKYANAQVYINTGVNTVGGALGAGAALGKSLLTKAGGKEAAGALLDESLGRVIKSRLARVAESQAINQATAQAGKAASYAYDVNTSAFSNPQAQEAQKEYAEKEKNTYASDALDTALSTLVTTLPIDSVTAHMSYAADVSRYAQQIEQLLHQRANAPQSEAPKVTPAVPTQGDLFPTIPGEPSRGETADQHAARMLDEAQTSIDKNNRRAVADANQTQAELELANRDVDSLTKRAFDEKNSTGSVSPDTQYALDIARGKRDDLQNKLPEQPAAQPTPVIPDTEPTQLDAFDELDKQNKQNRLDSISQLRNDTLAAKENADRVAAAKQEAADKLLWQKAVQKLVIDNPGMSIEDIDAAVPAMIEKLRSSNSSKKPLDTSINTAKKGRGKVAPPPTEAITIDLGTESNSTPTEESTLAGIKNSKDPVDSAVSDMLDKLNLGQETPKNTTTSAEDDSSNYGPPIDRSNFLTQAREIARALAKKSSKTVDVVNAIANGKLTIAPNPEYLGRARIGNRTGEYDASTGKSYIYADNVDPNNIVPDIIEAASHEGTHGLTMSDDQTRGAVLSRLVGDNTVMEGASKIREAARGGNKFAIDALKQAQKDTASRRQRAINAGLNPDKVNASKYEDAELVAYFTGAVNKNRQAPLGTARSAVSTLVAGARNIIRDKLGVNLDLNIHDLEHAATKVLGQYAKQKDITPRTASKDQLGMMAGVRSNTADTSTHLEAREREANNESKYSVYDNTGWWRGKDGKWRYEIDDSKATFNPNLKDAIKSGGTLPDIMNHKDLYDAYPELRDVKVRALTAKEPRYDGAFYADDNTIALNTDMDVNDIKSTLLHEIQHKVQLMEDFARGGNPRTVYNSLSDADKKSFVRVVGNNLNTIVNRIDSTIAKLKAGTYEGVHDTALNKWIDEIVNDKDANPVDALNAAKKEALEDIEYLDSGSTYKIKKVLSNRGVLYRAYYRLAGEVEARNVAHRINMSAEERKDKAPWDTESISHSSQLLTEDYMKKHGIPFSVTADEAKQLHAEDTTMGQAAKETGDSEENFRKWFANSKAVTADGNPLMLFHGTNTPTLFDSFKASDHEIGIHVGTAQQAGDPAFVGRIYNKDYVPNVYTSDLRPRIYPLYASIQNPLRAVIDSFGDKARGVWLGIKKSLSPEEISKIEPDINKELDKGGSNNTNAILAIKNGLIKLGYDGIVYANSAEGMDPAKLVGHEGALKKLPAYPYGASEPADSYVVFNPSQLKSVLNKGEWSSANEDILGQASSKEEDSTGKWRNKSTLNTVVTSLFRNDKGLGSKVMDAVLYSRTYPAVYESRANAAVGHYEAALSKLAEERGTTVNALNKEIASKLEELYNMKGLPSEYLNKFNDITSSYGEAGKQLRVLRQITDDLSREYVQSYIDHGGKLGDKQVREIRTVLSNLGRYTHRFYAAFQGHGLGDLYSSKVIEAVNKARDNKKLTPKQEELYNTYNAARAVILDDLIIPQDVGKLSEDKVNYLYDTWATSSDSASTTEQKREVLAARRNEIGSDALNAQADINTKALLQLVNETPAVKYYRGNLINRGILQKRKQVPVELRNLLGEITDPAGALLVTVSKNAELVSKTKLLLSIRDNADANDLQPPENGWKPIVENNNMKKLEGEGYGPLNGWYASPTMRAMIDDSRDSLSNFSESVAKGQEGYGKAWGNLADKAVHAYMKAAGVVKALKIVGNLHRYVVNFAGATMMPAFNGNIDAASYGAGLKSAVDLIRYARNPSLGLRSAENAVHYGVTDSATVGDLKLLDNGKIERIVKEMAGKSPNALMSAVRTGVITSREAYAMMDVWAKIANFEYESKHLTDLYKAAKIDKSEEEVRREAASIVNFTNVTYTKSLPLIKMLERGGLSMYANYMYEVNRTQITNAIQGVKEILRAQDMPTDKAKALTIYRGTKRLLGQAAIYSAVYTTSKMLGKIFSNDADKEDNIRSLLPPGSRNGDFIPVGVASDGKLVLYNISAVDPIGPYTDLIRAARRGDSLTSIMEQFKSNYVSPSLAPLLANALTGGSLGKPKQPLLQEWFPDTYGKALQTTEAMGIKDQTVQAWNNLAESMLPGTIGTMTSRNPKVTKAYNNDDLSKDMYSILQYIGMRGYKLDPDVSARSASIAYRDTLNNSRDSLYNFIRNVPTATPEEIVSKVNALAIGEKKAWDDLYKVRQGMIDFGMSPAKANTILKKAQLPVGTIVQLHTGKYRSSILNLDSFIKTANSSISKLPKEKQQAAKEHWKLAARALFLNDGEGK